MDNNREPGQIGKQLSDVMDIRYDPSFSREQIIAAISLHIAGLVNNHPEQLFSLLYRLDVSEKKVALLIEREKDTGNIAQKIAALIYERQLEKYILRKKFTKPQSFTDEDLKW